MNDEKRLMRAALHMAERGLGRVWPNPSVGCVIVREGRVIASAATASGGRPHAETIALQQAGQDAQGATVFVTLEPCAHEGKTPPCINALIEAKVKKVVIGTIDPDPRTAGKGIAALKEAGIEVVTGICEPECRSMNAGFFTRVTKGHPWICLKAACTAQGHLNPPEGRWISGSDALNDVHMRRRKYDAILIGIETALADDPMLTPRMPGFNTSPVRIVLDSHLRLPETSNLARTAGIIPLWIMYADDTHGRAKELEKVGARLIKTPHHDVAAAMKILADKGLTRILVEGGATVHNAFLKADLCDEMNIYRSKTIIEGRASNPFASEILEDFARKQGLSSMKTREWDQDSLEIWRRKV